jgi:hypothetical protein
MRHNPHMVPRTPYNPFHHGGAIHHMAHPMAHHPMAHHVMHRAPVKRRAPRHRGGISGFGIGAGGLLLGGARAKAAAMKKHRERHGVAKVINPKTGREVWADSKIGMSVIRKMGL